MPIFLESVESCFGCKDLYEVLDVRKEAKDNEIKRAYLKLSLKVHPDRVEPQEVEKATVKFQVLGKIYSVLKDKDKRSIYDEEGIVDEEDDTIFEQDKDWCAYWRLLFPKVTVEDISKFEKSYKGSEEERDAIKSTYLEKEGDMDAIMEEIMCATLDDEGRFRELIEGWIKEGEVPPFPAFVKETKAKKKKRRMKWKAEAEEAEKSIQGLKQEGCDASLTSIIRTRQQTREQNNNNLLDTLEDKYASKKPKTAASTKDPSCAEGSRSKSGKGKRVKRKKA